MTGIMNMLVGGAAIKVEINPPSNSTTSNSSTKDTVATATAVGGVATSYSWGVLFGSGTVMSGGATDTATLRVTDLVSDPGGETAVFYCDVTVGGVVYRGTCSYTHDYRVI